MSLIDEIKIVEIKRDRYARESTFTNGRIKIQCPANGIGLRSKKDLETFIKLRLNFPTERLGFCIVSLANADRTFIEMQKTLNDEKHKLAPTAEGRQLKMFQNQTFLAVEPATERTYYYQKDECDKLLASLESPNFIKEIIIEIKQKLTQYDSGRSQEFQDWKINFMEEKWLELSADPIRLNELVNDNFDSQNRCQASIQIPPTPPLVKRSLFYVSTKIIERATVKAKSNTAVYFNMPFSILKDEDFRQQILNYCEKSTNKIIILKIHDLDNMLDPDKEDQRQAFSEIQEKMCELRKNNKFTILLEGGKLTFPSLVRGFDIVTNHIAGKNKKGGPPNKKRQPTELIGFRQYFIKEKQIFYQYPKMITYTQNHLILTNGEHGLKCSLPCCKDVKSIDDLPRDIWNNSIVRPHYCLTINEMAKEISRLINENKIQDAKNILLLSELCVLKHLIPDV